MATASTRPFVTRALFLDRADPVQAWADLSARQAELVARLSAATEIRIEADGTDLTLERRRAHLDQLRRPAQHAQRRGVHRPP